MSDEQKYKKEFRELEATLHGMREQLTRLENINIFQKPKGSEHNDILRGMKKKVEEIETKAEGYPGTITWHKPSEDTSHSDSTDELTHTECKVSIFYVYMRNAEISYSLFPLFVS